jgi:uncharacterized paraquat-inducible protein A
MSLDVQGILAVGTETLKRLYEAEHEVKRLRQELNEKKERIAKVVELCNDCNHGKQPKIGSYQYCPRCSILEYGGIGI